MAAVRAIGAVVPLGVYRFASFEEADEWMIRTIVERSAVVRIADEVVVDLMARACGVDYAEASRDAETAVIAGALRARRFRRRSAGARA